MSNIIVNVEDYFSESNPEHDYLGYKISYSFKDDCNELITEDFRQQAEDLAKETATFIASRKIDGEPEWKSIENGFLVYSSVSLGSLESQ